MASVTHVTQDGDFLTIHFDDGAEVMATPTDLGGWWLANGGGDEPVGPGDGSFIQPFEWSTVSSEFGPRDGTRFHEGIDFGGGAVGGVGTPIICAGNGVVEVRGTNLSAAYGNYVIVDHGLMPDGPHVGKRVKTLYAHMVNPPPVSVGDPTVAGVTVLGGVGNTGTASSGAHLHWEVHVMNDGSGIVHNLNNNGGYRTAVSPRIFIAAYGT